MSKVKDLHRSWLKDPGYKAEYDRLDEEFQLARTLIEARNRAGLSQAQLARRMRTLQSYIARIESGQVQPSANALARFAHALRFGEHPHACQQGNNSSSASLRCREPTAHWTTIHANHRTEC